MQALVWSCAPHFKTYTPTTTSVHIHTEDIFSVHVCDVAICYIYNIADLWFTLDRLPRGIVRFLSSSQIVLSEISMPCDEGYRANIHNTGQII